MLAPRAWLLQSFLLERGCETNAVFGHSFMPSSSVGLIGLALFVVDVVLVVVVICGIDPPVDGNSEIGSGILTLVVSSDVRSIPQA